VFKDGSTSLGTASLDGAGQATITTSALTLGTHAITAVYSGDSAFGSSTSPTLVETVDTPADSQRLRDLQIRIAKFVAMASGGAISGAIEDAIADGFGSQGDALTPSEAGLRMS